MLHWVSAARRYQALWLSSPFPQLKTSSILRFSTCCLYRRPTNTWRHDYFSAIGSYHLEVGYVVFVSAARRYDPEGVGGLGTDGQGEQGGWSLRRIGGPPIPSLTFHIIEELVSADRRYQVFLVYHFPNTAIWYWQAGDTELH